MDLRMWKVFSNVHPAFASDVKLALVAGSGSQVGIMVMRNGDVYSIGTSSTGLLGIPGITSSPIPVRINALCGKDVVGISGGSDFLIALTAGGAVYTWGTNEHGQLGIGATGGGSKSVPQNCYFEGKVINQISCGHSHVLAMTTSGEVFAWGGNDQLQVGNGSVDASVPSPVRVLPVPDSDNGAVVVSICCSSTASLALLDNGQVYGWGHTNVSDPKESVENIATPQLITIVVGVKQIVAGSNSALALSGDGKLYYWGSTHTTPTHIAADNGPVLEIAGTWYSETFAFRTDSGVYLWGEFFGARLSKPRAHPSVSLDHALLVFTGTTWRPLVFECKETPMGKALVDSLDNSKTGDVKFQVQDTIIHAHKVFLLIRSRYFHKILQESTDAWKKNGDDTVIPIADASPGGFRSFLEYLYTDTCYAVGTDETVELLKLANRYWEEDLFLRCVEILKLLVSPENACGLYDIAVEYKAKELEKRILEFAAPNFPAVVNSQGFRMLSQKLTSRMIRKLVAQGVMNNLQPFSWADSEDGDEEENDNANEETTAVALNLRNVN